MPSVLLVAATAAFAGEAPRVEAEASAFAGWLEYRDLFTGDPLLGGFDARSSPFVLDRMVLSAALGATAWMSDVHRLRIRASSRTLRLETVLQDDARLGHALTSDGVPAADAALERLFVDEASWRVRPRRDRSIELSAGILPFSAAGRRILVESWPGASAAVDIGRLGGPPLAADARFAVTTSGAVQGAVSLARTWSMFDQIRIELAAVHDPRGLASVAEDDLGLLLGVFGATSGWFVQANAPALGAWLSEAYFDDPYGLERLRADTAAYLELDGRGTLGYASLVGEGVIGGLHVDSAVIFGFGAGTAAGDRLPAGSVFVSPPPDWPVTAPRTRWSQGWRMASFAADLRVERLGAVGPFGFVQAASGDPDLVDAVGAERAIHAFVAPDQAFARTRLFPADVARVGGAWSWPAGVGSYGIVAVGAGARFTAGPGSVTVQASVPWSWVGVCTGCAPGSPLRRHQGVELDAYGRLRLWQRAEPFGGALGVSADAGLFRPGRFFVDDSDPDRDAVSDLPTGWRVLAGLDVAFGPPGP